MVSSSWRHFPLFLMSCCVISCATDPEPDAAVQSPDRLFIPTYGSFGVSGSSGLSVFHTGVDTLEKDAFFRNNGRKIPSGAQSVTLVGNSLLVACTDSGVVSVIDIRTMKETQIINLGPGTGPNYLYQPGDGNVYVTAVYANQVFRINATTFQITGSVTVGSNPVQMAHWQSTLFVANSGYGYGKSISTIDLNTFTVTGSIPTHTNPGFMAVSGAKLIWLSSGNSWDPAETPDAFLVMYDPATRKVVDSLQFVGTYLNNELAVHRNGDVYFNDTGIWKVPVQTNGWGEPTCVTKVDGHPVLMGDQLFVVQDRSSRLTKILTATTEVSWPVGFYPSGSTVYSVR